MVPMSRLPFLLLLVVAWPGSAPAAQRWFDIELVIFARDGSPGGSEVWPEVVDLPDTKAARAPGYRAPLRLHDAVERLRRQPGYRVLLHTAWRQPTGSRDSAPWIRLTDGGNVGLGPALDGMARLSLRRYLHLDLDLVTSRELDVPYAVPEPAVGTVAIPLGDPGATPPATPPPAPTAYRRVLQPFRMVDSRRMRSDEVHYVDHPVLGVLALATAYQPPAPAEPAIPPAAGVTDGAATSQPPPADPPAPTPAR